MGMKETAKRHDALWGIRETIGGCFGNADHIFAGHPADEKRAKGLRKIAADNDITMNEVEDIALGYLYRNGCVIDHIKEQITEVRRFFGKKLD